ncbi:MAG: SsrA-binding protein SmpB [Phycisphaerae bacterium]|jgi:SsrA-binding protein|nr:SsrA-binding protein SmpB [Phycisphaerae bacterium]MCZ2399404.1 SsrA-binding protein SmpB [Phycisphaerae bacterium]NUQ49299.1 SsrA-binding protein SmpB [Phycisphaerae bacterium]
MTKRPASSPRITNRKASFRFEILEKIEAGVALTGSEVKSLRAGKASLEEAFAMVREGEAFLRDCNISPYENAGYAQHAPTRERRLLLHKREIRKLHSKLTQQGLTLIPLEMHFNDRGRVKVLLAVCRGKKLHDKRTDLMRKQHQRDMDRAMKRR